MRLTSPWKRTSLTANRPPGLSTRKASASTRSLSVERLITQLLMITSTEASGSGMLSISPLRNSTLSTPALRWFVARQSEHLVGHVEAVGLAGGADATSRQQDVDAAAAAEVEDDLARVADRRARSGCRSRGWRGPPRPADRWSRRRRRGRARARPAARLRSPSRSCTARASPGRDRALGVVLADLLLQAFVCRRVAHPGSLLREAHQLLSIQQYIKKSWCQLPPPLPAARYRRTATPAQMNSTTPNGQAPERNP